MATIQPTAKPKQELTLQEVGQGTIESFRTSPEEATEEFERLEQSVTEKRKEELSQGEK